MSRTLDGRRVLVTGGGSGIGRASAVRLASEGAAVVVADVRVQLAEQVAADIRRAGGEAHPVHCDVGDEGSVIEAIAASTEALGGLDGVVASAGVVTAGRTHDLTLHDWELVLRVNLTGVFLTVKHALPALIEAGGGAIVTIGSVSSLVIGAGGSAVSYKAAKGGVLQLTRAVAVEYVGDGIRANCVCPGHVATSIGDHARELAARTTSPHAAAPPITIEPPMTRAADPAEVAGVVAFLLSDDASFMTGSAVMVDGGYTAI